MMQIEIEMLRRKETEPNNDSTKLQSVSSHLQGPVDEEEPDDRLEHEKVKLDFRVTGDEGTYAMESFEGQTPHRMKDYAVKLLSDNMKLATSKVKTSSVRIASKYIDTLNKKPSSMHHMIVTIEWMDGELYISKNKIALKYLASRLHASSKLILRRRKSMRWQDMLQLRTDGKNAFFLGHRPMVADEQDW